MYRSLRFRNGKRKKRRYALGLCRGKSRPLHQCIFFVHTPIVRLEGLKKARECIKYRKADMNSIKNKVKNILLSNFPDIRVTVYLDDGYTVYSINNKGVYYSQEYLMLVTDINCNILYPRGIYNTLFVCDE